MIKLKKILKENLHDDVVKNDIEGGKYTKEEYEQATYWFEHTLSINEMRRLLRKYHPFYDSSTYRYHKYPPIIQVDIWKNEGRPLGE